MASLEEVHAHLRAGDAARARQALDRLGGSGPDADAERLRAGAWVAHASGKGEAAIALMRRAALGAPSALPAIELAQMLAAAGASGEAIAALQDATARHPGDAAAWHALGVALYQARRDEDARDAFARALACAPGHPQLLRALAEAEYTLERHDQAAPLFEQLAASGAGDAGLQLRRAQCRRKRGDADGALVSVDWALARFPDDAPLWLERGWIQEDLGDATQAAAAYARAAALRPDWGDAVGAALALARRDAPADLIERANALAQASGTPPMQRSYLHMVLGKHADACGEHAAAATHWQSGNALRRAQDGGFDRAAYAAQVDGLIAAFDREDLAALHARAWRDPRPLFVVGMPRSGTTLAEQVLAAHPQVHGGGERTAIVAIAQAVAALPGLAWPTDAARIPTGWLHAQARGYLDEGARAAPPGATRLVDKQPYNFLHVGLLATLFADARIVWCRRDPRDIAVSIFGENFSPLATYATDLGDIAFVEAQQERLMRHWQSVGPLPMLELRYEDMVADHEAQVRRLVEFAGLPWDPACLEFHASGRSVQTLSRWQVRQPIHPRSVGRWRRYRQWFAGDAEPD